MTENHVKKDGNPITAKALRTLGTVLTGLLAPFDITLPHKSKKTGQKIPFSVSFTQAKIAIFTMAYYVLQPLSTFLMPRAEDVLKKEGMDPKMETLVSDARDIRVVPDNILGKTYFLLDRPPLFNPMKFWATSKHLFNEDVRGFHAPRHPGILVRLLSPGLKRVYNKTDDVVDADLAVMRKLTEEASKGAVTFKGALDGADFRKLTLLHEIRHTASAQDDMTPLYREADADYHAIRAWAAENGGADAEKKALREKMFRSAHSDGDHDVALYLHFAFNGAAIPAEEDIRAANAEAAPYITQFGAAYAGAVKGSSPLTAEFNARAAIAADAGATALSPLARLRLDLYMDAMSSFFVPKAGVTP